MHPKHNIEGDKFSPSIAELLGSLLDSIYHINCYLQRKDFAKSAVTLGKECNRRLPTVAE